MYAYERMVADDGYEVMLFPLPYMNISQGENGSYSHQGTLNIDFLGWGANGRITQAPVYAPCSCKCVSIVPGSANGRVFQSINKVHTPQGLQHVCFMNFHDNNPIASLNQTFTQGDLIAHTGTAGNVTGDHIHLNTSFGTYQGRTEIQGHVCLVNSSHIYQTCYVNDTTIVNGYGYNWVNYEGEVNPPFHIFQNSHFKWVLYANKIRNKYWQLNENWYNGGERYG